MKPNNAPLPGGFVLNNLSPLPRSIDTGSSHETLKRNKCKYISYLSNYCSIESRLLFAQHNISAKNKILACFICFCAAFHRNFCNPHYRNFCEKQHKSRWNKLRSHIQIKLQLHFTYISLNPQSISLIFDGH